MPKHLVFRMAVQMGLEPTISSVTGRHVKPLHHWTKAWNFNGADEGNWTPVSALARLCSTIELHLHEWRSRWDSNPRSPPWQGGMLTTTPLDQNYFSKIRWRRRRDLNSRASFPTYTLSRGTSSATWVLLQEYFQISYFLKQPALSVTPVYNNMDKNLLQANF